MLVEKILYDKISLISVTQRVAIHKKPYAKQSNKTLGVVKPLALATSVLTICLSINGSENCNPIVATPITAISSARSFRIGLSGYVCLRIQCKNVQLMGCLVII